MFQTELKTDKANGVISVEKTNYLDRYYDHDDCYI